MSEQASKVLIDLLEKASNGVDSAVAFSQAQIPEVISQLLAWKMAMGIIWFAFGLATIAFAVFIPVWAGRQRRKGALWTYYDGDARFNLSSISYDFIRTPFPLGLLFIGVLISVVSLNFWLKILIAPKLYLIEYAALLIK
ncbi:hypothetical protein JEP40_08035 [Proteus vulgaris]|uniref:hypothetical protein n=1 Tax=Proteus vulgaris TaxID=585 RepID=UPI0018E4C0F6|nr:hypothetical protein [Proteus vulgaris]MBI6529062.1 hypothetical protein [Proteus vulgaris]